MKFSQLNIEVQREIVQRYILARLETNPEETLIEGKAFDLCLNAEDRVEYTINGA